jgi:hypothetical protein
MHAALDVRISAVMPALIGRISFDDEEIALARQLAVEPVLRMIASGQASGQLRSDVAFADIGTLLVRLSRPLPGPFPQALDLGLAHRHVDVLLYGLRTLPGSTSPELSGPALTLGDLRRIGSIAAR